MKRIGALAAALIFFSAAPAFADERIAMLNFFNDGRRHGTAAGHVAQERQHDRVSGLALGQGLASAEAATPGSIFEARFDGEGAGVQAHTHRQRHFPETVVLRAMESVRLECVEVAGEHEGHLEHGVDEDLHTKAVYLCRLAG